MGNHGRSNTISSDPEDYIETRLDNTSTIRVKSTPLRFSEAVLPIIRIPACPIQLHKDIQSNLHGRHKGAGCSKDAWLALTIG